MHWYLISFYFLRLANNKCSFVLKTVIQNIDVKIFSQMKIHECHRRKKKKNRRKKIILASYIVGFVVLVL